MAKLIQLVSTCSSIGKMNITNIHKIFTSSGIHNSEVGTNIYKLNLINQGLLWLPNFNDT